MNTSRTSTEPEPLPLDAMVWVATVALLQRAVLGLCLQRDYTCGEVARLLDLPRATIAGLLAAGVRDLAPQPTRGSANG